MGNFIDNPDNPIVYIYIYKSYDGETEHKYKKYINCFDVFKYGEHRLKHRRYPEYRGHKRNKIINDIKNYNKYIEWKKKNYQTINIKCPICKINNNFISINFNLHLSKEKTICVCCMDIKNNILFTKCTHSCLCLECCKYISDSIIIKN